VLIFQWDDENKDHIALHDVTPVEAKEVVHGAVQPYAMDLGGGKWLVRGMTAAGRFLQVIYVYRPVETIDLDTIDPEDRLFVLDEEEVAYVIHARDLTEKERRSARKRRR
jgi:uncharacterized DUF497 family protein